MEKQEVRNLRQKFSRCKAMLVCEQGCWGSITWREEAAWGGVSDRWAETRSGKVWRVLFRSWHRTFLAVQWIRIHPPMRRTWVQSLVQEDKDSTCCRVTKLVCHNYWACAQEPRSHSYWAPVQQFWGPRALEPVLCNEKPPQGETTREGPHAAVKTQHSQK